MEYFNTIEKWLKNLPEDARVFNTILADEKLSKNNRQIAAGVINYIFKSIDLIPDGIDDIGYLDDVFTIRLSAELINAEEIKKLKPEIAKKLETFKQDISVIREILGEDLFLRLRNFTTSLIENSARGRKANQIVESQEFIRSVQNELSAFCDNYNPPSIEKTEATIIKLRAYLDTRLPR